MPLFFLFQTQKTVFEARTEKRCDIHFKKECWIDYKEQSKSQTIHVCTTKPERKCDLTAAEKEAFGKTECNTYYETVSGIHYILISINEKSRNIKYLSRTCSLVVTKSGVDSDGVIFK